MAKGDIISRLKLESGEFDSKIKRAGQELLAYSEHCRKMGLSMGYANRDAKEFAKQLGSMATVSTTARGKINELSEAFVNAKVMYKNMTDEEKKGEFGKNLAASLDQLKSRLNSAKQDLADVNKELAGGGKFGEFGNILDTLGSKMGVTGNLTEMLTSKTALLTGAVGAGIAIVTKATEAWAGYNAELAKQDQITTVTTGLKGEDADRMTDKMRALSDTYNVDFREAVNAANTLMTQFGKTGDEATQLIKDGMQGMIQGDGPKLLSMIQNYAPAFRSAGLEASQLVAIIHNSEGGLFTDQNMQAIIMGLGKIRNMTKSTAEALRAVGIDTESMKDKMRNGSMTVFDALQQVGRAIDNNKEKTEEVGAVMQEVFGRQARTAGDNLGKAIANLNTNLEETKKQTGELGDTLADLQTANEKLNKAIREAFSYDGWDQMATGIRSKLITALADVIGMLGTIRGWFNSIEDDVRKGLGQTVSRNGGTGFGGGGNGGGIRGNNNPAPPPPPRPGGSNKTTTSTNGIKDEFTDMEELVGLIPVAEQKVKDLQQQIRESWDGNQIASLRKELKAAQDELDVLQGKLPKDSKVELTITADDTDALQKVKDIEGVTLDEKTMTVTANTQEALQKVQELVADVDGKVVNVKVVPVITDDDIDKQLQRQYGKAIQVPITPKLTAGEELVQSIRIKLVEDNINADMQTLRTLMETQIKNGIEGVDIPAEWIAEQIFGEGMDIPDKTWQALQDQINEKLRELQIDPIKIDFKTGNIEKQTKQMTEDWKSAASAIQSVGSAMAQIEDPMTKVIGTIAQAVATMALSYAQAAASPAVTGSGWGWIAFAATGVSTMLSSIAAIKQATAGFYAEGGIVPGNNHNDGLLAHVSSGELILNRAQQNSIASQLEGGMNLPQNLQLETRVDAEELIIMLNNNGLRRGLGRFING